VRAGENLIRLILRGALAILATCLVGCANQPTFQSLLVSPLQPPSNLATPTVLPTKVVSTETPQPTATKTATAEPSLTPTPSPSPEPTATYPPYAGTPFTITFIRDGNLWLSEIGGTGERHLTHESNDWPVVEYVRQHRVAIELPIYRIKARQMLMH
jgi:hypothetical protein